jgi:hypothetical protein
MTIKFRSDVVGGAIINESGTEVIKVGTGGNITLSGILKTSSVKKTICAAHLAATTQAITVNVYSKVIFDTATLNPGTGYNTANGRFTPDVAGWYEVDAAISLEGSTTTDNVQAAVYKNGAAARRLAVFNTVTTTNMNTMEIGGSGLVYLNGTTDYVEIFVYRGQGSGTAAVSGNSTGTITHFSVKLVYPD